MTLLGNMWNLALQQNSVAINITSFGGFVSRILHHSEILTILRPNLLIRPYIHKELFLCYQSQIITNI